MEISYLRNKPLLVAFLFSVAAFPLFFSGSANAAELPTTTAQINPKDGKWCHRCHGENGVSSNPRIPNLAGQHILYLVKQIKMFGQETTGGASDGAIRTHRSMGFNVKKLNPEEFEQVARYYASNPCRVRGDKAVSPIAAPSAATACKECHGEKGISKIPIVPNLAGQKRMYLENQLKIFRMTSRDLSGIALKDWRQHPMMRDAALTLSDSDISALAEYFSKLDCQ